MSDLVFWPADPLAALGAVVIGYLLGSIPFGLILTRMAGLGDIRKIGSGNIGTTNVLRTGRKDIAAATLVGDALKGTAAVLLAGHLWGAEAGLLAGLAAFLGHIFPVWLRFRGGKGVATFLGILIGVAWPAALAFAAIWLLVAFLTRYSSLSALIAGAATPVVLLALDDPRAAGLFVVLAVIVIVKHHANIRRLLSGTESRIGSKG